MTQPQTYLWSDTETIAPQLTTLMRQLIYGDFCGDNPGDLTRALQAREELVALV